MSTRPVRDAQAVGQAAAVQAAAEARRHDTPAHHGHHGPGHRGQFGGFVFRLGRAPAAPTPRRPVPLRRRPPRPPGAHPAGMDPDDEHGLTLNMALLPQSSAIEDEERAASMDIDAMDRQGEPHEGTEEPESRQRLRALQWRVGSQAQPDAGTALLPALQAVCGADAQALWTHSAPNAAVRPEDLARALVGALLGLNSAGPVTLQLAAVRAYLVKGLEAGAVSGPLATLERVKRALLEHRARKVPRPDGALPDEAQQNRNLLLPLKLLNADRPRTAEQVRQACSRIELSCRAGLAMDTVASSA